MLDSAMCQEVSPTRLWTIVSWGFVFLISHRPGLVVLVALLVVSLPWLLRLSAWKKPVVITLCLLALAYGVVTSAWFAGMGNRLLAAPVPPDTGEPAEVVVVLGRGYQQNTVRSLAAFELWQQNRAPAIFLSGRSDAPKMAANLTDWAVPESAIAGEPCSLTTDQNAEFTASILRPQGVQRIILVTDSAHMLRSFLTFKSFGFNVIPYSVSLDKQTNQNKSRFLVFRESLGLLSYGIMGRYFSREVPPVSQ